MILISISDEVITLLVLSYEDNLFFTKANSNLYFSKNLVISKLLPANAWLAKIAFKIVSSISVFNTVEIWLSSSKHLLKISLK